MTPTSPTPTSSIFSLIGWQNRTKERPLSGIIYLHSIQDPCMFGPSLQNLRVFQRLCGESNLRNVLLTTTKWGITPFEDAERREHELKTNDDFWGLMIKKAARGPARFDNTKAGARHLVDELLETGDAEFTPQIQYEVVEEGKTLWETEAGTFLNRMLIEHEKKYQEEKKALKEEYEQALAERKSAFNVLLVASQTLFHSCLPQQLSFVTILNANVDRNPEDRSMEEAIKKKLEELQTQHTAEEKRRDLLHQGEMTQLEKKIEDLKSELETRNGEYINRQGFWHSSWTCLICKKRKTKTAGNWTCPMCQFRQTNVEWEP